MSMDKLFSWNTVMNFTDSMEKESRFPKEGHHMYIKDETNNIVCYAVVDKVVPHPDKSKVGEYTIILKNPTPLTEIE